MSKTPQTKIVLVLLIAFFLLFNGNRINGQDNVGEAAAPVSEGGETWSSFRSAYFTVYYEPDVNLNRVFSGITDRDIPRDPNPPTYSFSGIEAKVAYRLDALLARVKSILGMYPANMNITIKIYKKRKEINAEYCRLTNTGDEECKSFYVYHFNTIFASEQDITDSIMAHEMAPPARGNSPATQLEQENVSCPNNPKMTARMWSPRRIAPRSRAATARLFRNQA